MTGGIVIEEVNALPDDLDRELIDAALREGFAPLKWLKEQWLDGTNRFSNPGEALYVARIDDRLVGICGLNRDPYDHVGSKGRLRRLYVLPDFRRRGIGRKLVLKALKGSEGHFVALNLRTLDDRSAAFFDRLGFRRAEGAEDVTHEMSIR